MKLESSASRKPIFFIVMLSMMVLAAIGLAVFGWWLAHFSTQEETSKNTNTTPISSTIISQFRSLTASAVCAQLKNELYLIDASLIFWRREGTCTDNASGYELFNQRPANQVCSQVSTIAGPAVRCSDQTFAGLFTIIIDHLDSPTLGLDSSHQVERIQ